MPASKKRRYPDISPDPDISPVAQKQLNPDKESTKRHKSDAQGGFRRSLRKSKPTERFQSFMEEAQTMIAARSGRLTSTGFVRRAEGGLQLFIKDSSAAFGIFDSISSPMVTAISPSTPVALPSELSSFSQASDSEVGSGSSMVSSDEETSTSSEWTDSDTETDSSMALSGASDNSAFNSSFFQQFPKVTPIKNKSARMPSGIDGLQNGFGQSGTPVRSSVLPSRCDGQQVFSYISGAIAGNAFEIVAYQKEDNFHISNTNRPAHLFERSQEVLARQQDKGKRKKVAPSKITEWSDAKREKFLSQQLPETKQCIEFSGVFNKKSLVSA